MKRVTRSRAAGPTSGADQASSASIVHGRRVLTIEAAALAALAARLDARFDAAVQLIAGRGGKVVVTGMGKS